MATVPDISQVRADFLRIVKRRSPQAFDYAMKQFLFRRRRLSSGGMGQADETATDTEAVTGDASAFDSFLQTLKDLVPIYTSYQLSQDLYQLNLERVRQGLPPVDAQSVSPQVNVGLSSDAKTMLLLGGGALLAILLFGQMRR
jgi:hypothetical protein